MTPIDLRVHFQAARDRLIAITKLGMPDLVKVNAYADNDQPTPPYAEIVVNGLSNTPIASGKQDITVPVEVRVWCGQAQEGFDGSLQDKIFFTWLPDITQKFIEYNNLCYPGATERIGPLDTERTGFKDAKVILAGDAWLLVFMWQLTFITGYKKAVGV